MGRLQHTLCCGYGFLHFDCHCRFLVNLKAQSLQITVLTQNIPGVHLCPLSPIPQVVQRIKAVENETRLLVVDQDTHECLRNLRLTATEEMAIPGEEPPPPFLPPDPPSPAPTLLPTSPSEDKSEEERNGSAMLQSMLQRSTSCQVPKHTRRLPSLAAKKVNASPAFIIADKNRVTPKFLNKWKHTCVFHVFFFL